MYTFLKIICLWSLLIHELVVAYNNKLGICGREKKMGIKAQNTATKVWMVVEVGYTWTVSLVEVSEEGNNYAQCRLTFWHLENA